MQTATAAKERPILFSGPMVRALLDGRKTQTRRALKDQPPEGCGEIEGPSMFAPTVFVRGEAQPGPELFGAFSEDGEWSIKCPYGQPGDRLWVREAHVLLPRTAYRGSIGTGTIDQVEHPTDGYTAAVFREGFDRSGAPRWRPSIHMPRWASRILLEVVSVRVERLKDISEKDAKAEGLAEISKDGKMFKFGIPDRDGLPGTDDHGWPWRDWKHSARNAYWQLWESINGDGSWDANPWVWVVEFKRIDQQEKAS
ncbi:hypothetical protein [Kushneria konosiri]|uniref:Morphogenetic protein n=1 Tax=Kushneria konosiri TaxID=698828 RepID=A0A2Z2H2Y5_9GAMM|nr:hypothetical protein [Kushneria konosiri]ARS51532.1 hypothetical protein B9G99_00295 [Kushneria konosiri]